MDDVTIGELSRRLNRIETHMETGFASLASQITSLQFVGKAEYLIQIKTMEDRIAELEDAKTWTARAVFMAIVTAIIIPALMLLVFRGTP